MREIHLHRANELHQKELRSSLHRREWDKRLASVYAGDGKPMRIIYGIREVLVRDPNTTRA